MSSFLADQQRPRMSLNAGGGGVWGLSQWVQLCTRSPNKLWRSSSIINIWFNWKECGFVSWVIEWWWQFSGNVFMLSANDFSWGCAFLNMKIRRETMSKNKTKKCLEFEHSSIFYVTIGTKKNDTILQTVVQVFNMNCFAKFRRTRKKCQRN